MNLKSRLLFLGLATAGSLSIMAGPASAQAIFVDPYPVTLAPVTRHVVIERPAPVVRERTIIVGRPVPLPPPVYPRALPRYGYVEEIGYLAPGW